MGHLGAINLGTVPVSAVLRRLDRVEVGSQLYDRNVALDSVVATSVLPNVLGAIVGAGALVLGVWLTARYAKSLDARKHREGLASEAFSDFWRAMAQSAFVGEGQGQAEALAVAAHAKARLVTYGDSSLVSAVQRFDDNGANGADPECQAAIVAIAQGLRAATEAPGTLSDEQVRRVLFG